jgi:hypothetical protein
MERGLKDTPSPSQKQLPSRFAIYTKSEINAEGTSKFPRLEPEGQEQEGAGPRNLGFFHRENRAKLNVPVCKSGAINPAPCFSTLT